MLDINYAKGELIMFKAMKAKLGMNVDKTISILAPIEGDVVSIKEVSDPVFAEELLGAGVAIRPTNGKVVAPVNGTIAVMFETKHAVSIIAEDGAEILIHIGLDTVNLKGEFFKSYVEANDKVKAGDLLIEFDKDQIQAAGYDVISPIIICNTAEYEKVHGLTDRYTQILEPIMELGK